MARPKKSAEGKDARRNIMDAIWLLALEMPFDKITVQGITQRAACNRTTFYYHFETIEDAKSAFIDSFFEQASTEACLSTIEGDGTAPEPPAVFDSMCTILALNQSGELRHRIKSTAVERARKALSSTKLSDVQIELRSVLAAEGALSMMAYRGAGENAIELGELAKARRCLRLT